MQTGPLLPKDIAGCVCWLDGSDPSKFILSGTNIDRWTSSEGFNDEFAPYAISRPNYNALTGAVEYPVQGPQLACVDWNRLNNVDDFTIVLLARMISTDPNGFFRVFVGIDSGGSDTVVPVLCGQRALGGGDNRARIQYSGTGGGAGTPNDILTFGLPGFSGSLQTIVYKHRRNVTNGASVIIDGVETPALDTTIDQPLLNTRNLVLGGAIFDDPGGMIGELRQNAIYSRILSNPEIAAISAFYDTKR